jgi:tRNA-modifying protein YgfZ
MSVREFYNELGAELAADGIPLHFGDLGAEYHAALEAGVIFDRSHEGRLEVSGPDQVELLQRMSTNDLRNLQPGEGRPTIFTNPNARILDRVMVYNRGDDTLLVMGGPGRGEPLRNYLQRNIFFSDQVTARDLGGDTFQFGLHGPQADALIADLIPAAAELPELHSVVTDAGVFAGRMKPFTGTHWAIIVPAEQAVTMWRDLLEAGKAYGIQPAGGLTYNTLRIRAGQPGSGRELSTEYIPLEVGLWDEVSFTKGCYTGQEIIARMESRNRLARTIVSLKLDAHVDAPAEMFHEGKRAGKLTSSVLAPDGEIFAMGVVKTSLAAEGAQFRVGEGDGIPARVMKLLGAQPPLVSER